MDQTNTTLAPFHALPASTRRAVATRMIVQMRRAGFFGRGKYNLVSGRDRDLRPQLAAETGGEETALTASERNRLLAFARDMARNSETFSAVLKQFDLNCVGTVGGKAFVDFPAEYRDSALALREAFAAWARNCDFFDGEDFQTVLRLALRTKILGGDVVLAFDDGLADDSGKIMAFEPDEVANIPADVFAESYPEGFTQTQGVIRDAFGRFVGVFVSRSQRGRDVFAMTDGAGRQAVWAFHKAPGVDWIDSPFVVYRGSGRFRQGRGTSDIWPALAGICDLEDVTKYEVQAAKKNSQTLAQVTRPERNSVDGLANSGLANDVTQPDIDLDSPNAEADLMAAIEDAKKELGDDELTLDAIDSAGAIYDLLPAGYRMELLDTKHPNANMPEFIRWLAGRAAWTRGVGSVYATGKADSSYTAFRGEQVMSWPAFEDEQHHLEKTICDWAFRRWYGWATRRGMIPALPMPPNWSRLVRWTWPRMREVNQVDEQNAAAAKLRNLTGSYAEMLGPDWQERLLHVGEELEFCAAHKIPHPALQTVNGSVISIDGGAENKDKQETTDDGKNVQT